MKKRVIGLVLRRLARRYRGETMLESLASHRASPFQTLIATMMSARTRDEVTSAVASALFARYPTPRALSRAPLAKIRAIIRPINFYKGKAKRVREVARIIAARGGRVPRTVEELVKLPGVGVKTAGCVRVYAFHLPSIPTDVHVFRVSHRLGWAKAKTPEKTQVELEKLVQKRHWLIVNELFVLHGQQTCLPRNPRCCECVVKRYCPSSTC